MLDQRTPWGDQDIRTREYLIRSLRHYKANRFKKEIMRWGTPKELDKYKQFSYVKRRKDWLLGRFTAKELIQKYLWKQCNQLFAFHEIEILNRSWGQPYFQILKRNKKISPCFVHLSLSHCQGISFCGLVELFSVGGLGVDIELIAPRPPLFASTFYDKKEISQLKKYLGTDYLKAETAIWSLKEACLKALGQGLKIDTQKIIVSLSPPPWHTWSKQKIEINFSKVGEVMAWMRCVGSYVLAWVEIQKNCNQKS